jgi:hypothetical protein
MSLVCFVRATRASTTARRTPGEAFICRENSELVRVGMARCRHSVERTTSHRDGGATPSSVLRAAVLELAGRLARSRRLRAPGRSGGERATQWSVGDRGQHGATLASRTAGHATSPQERSGPPGNTRLIENREDVPRLSAVPDSRATGISRSELLLLVDRLHDRLNACFEELRTLPQATPRFAACHRQSTSSE